jgi:hypothetical protein
VARKRNLILTAALLTVAAAPASGNESYINTELLRKACGERSGLCVGYILGVHDQAQDTDTFCIPDGPNAGQVVAVVKSFIDNHPEYEKYSARSVVTLALKLSFPCEKQTQ